MNELSRRSAAVGVAGSCIALTILAALALVSASAQTATTTLPPAVATRDMRQLARQLRAQARDMPVEVGRLHAGALTLTIPATWLFTLDAAQLRPEARQRLEALAATLARAASTQLLVVGHSDALGPREFNQAFTLRRAEAVADYLLQRGVAPTRVTTRGAGEAEPVEGTAASPAARQRNRRIEIEVRPFRPSRREAS